jgi:ABC-type multidrug transport system ATPase subunit
VLTPSDVLDLFATAFGVPRSERRRRTSRLLEEFGLAHCAGRKFDLLSSGEKMRLVLAKALVNEPELVLLDEPTIGLDPDGAANVRREIARLNRERGVTILLTSHYMREVEELASEVAFIRDGRIVDTGPAAEVIARAMPAAAFVTVGRAPEGGEGALLGLGFERRGSRYVRAAEGADAVAAVVGELGRIGVAPSDFEVSRPNLEDYFLHMMEDRGDEAR